ncbi:MAG: site-specific DNA-methyltransferase [Dysgonamonadaceae bacterium]|jgi:site-specific DNA-methyltransferase (adenine-specific)|nr:site-specific DNA-methyltransferase [Dysgonamonadaceae bacterium]
MKERAERNRTITLSAEEYNLFSRKLCCLKKDIPVDLGEIVNKTVNNDLFDIIDLLPKQFADLIVVDPPYNLTRDFNGFTFKSSSKNRYFDYLRSWFPKVVSLLKPSGSMYLCGDWKCTSALQQVMEENLTVLNRITWQREKGRGALSNWKNAMEDIWFGVKDAKNYYFNVEAVKLKRKVLAPYKENDKPKDWEKTEEGNFRLTYPSNFWDDISIPYWSMPENTDHPTQKPEKLIAKLILSSCPENGIVFDPFLGSGTTSVVAKKLGRKYCGVEMNKEYCCWAEKRLERAETDKTIQGYSDGVFWERNTANLQTANNKQKMKPATRPDSFNLFSKITSL